MSETTFTFRVEEDLKNQFTKAAKGRDRSGAQLLRDFMRDFVRLQQEAADHDTWFRSEVQRGLDAANVGDLLSADDVEREFSARRVQTRGKLEASS